jgi:predicted nucleotidyltransferase
MRLKPYQIKIIRRVVTDLAGDDARVSLFGSQTNDNARGGDIDLLVEVPRPVEEPAWLSARISGRISHRLRGRKIDVVLSAPNLERFPIHEVAKKEAISL